MRGSLPFTNGEAGFQVNEEREQRKVGLKKGEVWLSLGQL